MNTVTKEQAIADFKSFIEKNPQNKTSRKEQRQTGAIQASFENVMIACFRGGKMIYYIKGEDEQEFSLTNEEFDELDKLLLGE